MTFELDSNEGAVTDGLDPAGIPPDAATIVLGMPHLDGRGLSMSWLMREAAHRHWWAIASLAGTVPSQLRDRDGDRVMASVVNCVVTGDLTGFSEDDKTTLGFCTRPTPQTGWLSVQNVESTSGASVSVELTTVFVKRRGDSNTSLVAAEMPEGLTICPSSDAAREMRIRRAQGRAERLCAEADERPPELSPKVFAPTDYNGVSLLYFANIVSLFERVEANALPPIGADMPVRRRALHYFGNVDGGDRIDLRSDTWVPGIEPDVAIVVRSSACRRSDGAVIAVCESIR